LISFHNFLLYFPYLFTIFFCIFQIFSLFNLGSSISFCYSICLSSILSISYHYSTCLSSIFSISFHIFHLYFPNLILIKLGFLPYVP
jgi:hypothetical protein